MVHASRGDNELIEEHRPEWSVAAAFWMPLHANTKCRRRICDCLDYAVGGGRHYIKRS